MDDLRPIAGTRSWWTQLSLRRPQRPVPPRLTFADLARIHHAWRADPDDAALGARYAEALAAFEYHHGEIDEAYWCLECASGVAVIIEETCGGRGAGRVDGARPPTRSTIAAMCSVVVPQQPPTTDTPKRSTNSPSVTASGPGCSGKIVSPFGP